MYTMYAAALTPDVPRKARDLLLTVSMLAGVFLEMLAYGPVHAASRLVFLVANLFQYDRVLIHTWDVEFSFVVWMPFVAVFAGFLMPALAVERADLATRSVSTQLALVAVAVVAAVCTGSATAKQVALQWLSLATTTIVIFRSRPVLRLYLVSDVCDVVGTTLGIVTGLYLQNFVVLFLVGLNVLALLFEVTTGKWPRGRPGQDLVIRPEPPVGRRACLVRTRPEAAAKFSAQLAVLFAANVVLRLHL